MTQSQLGIAFSTRFSAQAKGQPHWLGLHERAPQLLGDALGCDLRFGQKHLVASMAVRNCVVAPFVLPKPASIYATQERILRC